MLSPKDKLLLRELQFNFPLVERPYLKIAAKLGLTEKQVIERTAIFKEKGIIRYIGCVFNLRKLGMVSSLIALSVRAQDLPKVTEIINAYPQVTHNYLRRDEYNVWFTLHAPSKNKLFKLIKEIKNKTAAKKVLNLSTLKVFKIDARFRL